MRVITRGHLRTPLAATVGRPATYAALPEIIKGPRAKGLTPVKLSQLLAAS